MPADLNNLGVVAYFRALTSKSKLGRWLELQQADKLFSQAVDELDLSNSLANKQTGGVSENKDRAASKADILSNQYLCLRDSCRVKESRQTKLQAEKLRKIF